MKTTITSLALLTCILPHLALQAQPNYGTSAGGFPVLLPNNNSRTTGTASQAPAATSPAATSPPARPVALPADFQSYLANAVPTNFMVGKSIVLSWKNPALPFTWTYFDWVGLYRVGTRDSEFVERKPVIGPFHEMTFTPPTAGVYEIRYIHWTGETVLKLGPIVVNSPPPPEPAPFILRIERTGLYTSRVSWPTQTNKTYVLYVSPDLKDWEAYSVVTGTGTNATQTITTFGHAWFKALEH